MSFCLPLPRVREWAHAHVHVYLSPYHSFLPSPLDNGKAFSLFSKYLVEISGGSICTKYSFLAEDDLPHLDGVPLDVCHLLDVSESLSFLILAVHVLSPFSLASLSTGLSKLMIFTESKLCDLP